MSSPPQGEGETSQAAFAELSPRKQLNHLAWGLPAQAGWVRQHGDGASCSSAPSPLHLLGWAALLVTRLCRPQEILISLQQKQEGREGRICWESRGDLGKHEELHVCSSCKGQGAAGRARRAAGAQIVQTRVPLGRWLWEDGCTFCTGCG